MGYALEIGRRYLRSKKRATVSVISVIAVTGVALGVGALLSVVSITSGFQEEFRNKVLGVNAHVLVLKYGLNFEEYRDVAEMARLEPEVVGAAPFIINEMMLAKGDRLSGVLIKGVDPEQMLTVLDLPSQLTAGSLEGLRLPDSGPAERAEARRAARPDPNDPDNLDAMLLGLSEPASPPVGEGLIEELPALPALPELPELPDDDVDLESDLPAKPGQTPSVSLRDADVYEGPLPTSEVPTVDSMNAAFESSGQRLPELPALPDDQAEAGLLAELTTPQGAAGGPLPGVVLGVTLAENLGIVVGDTVRVVSQLSGVDTSMFGQSGATPRSRDFRVLGIFEAGFQEYDSKLVYMDLYEAQKFQDQGDTVIGVEISLSDIELASDVALRLERKLGGGPFHTMDWRELNNNLFTALEMQKVVLSLVIAIIIVVAAFNVIATLIMIVLEKRREIAILKAMGARDGAIMRIFMVQGAAIGVLGTGLGLLLGGAVCTYLTVFQFELDPKVYLISHLPVRTSPTEFLLTTAIALVICISSTIIPSWWAARMLPAEGVRPQ